MVLLFHFLSCEKDFKIKLQLREIERKKERERVRQTERNRQ